MIVKIDVKLLLIAIALSVVILGIGSGIVYGIIALGWMNGFDLGFIFMLMTVILIILFVFIVYEYLRMYQEEKTFKN